ncbi:amidohydrolase family protein [Flavivirga abyssicola]|uniref:amidohydrolase family protein n=1 Tax=Flavivirga abyssicola TaxID=3063533 RepID=UPI0026E0ABC2|nr:amidohydrolase family protein [Flavivirga sp. MEBiC07777]WVK12115.1 amidohydrolase family protein [Flavivirga sp. MEBiC07777]
MKKEVTLFLIFLCLIACKTKTHYDLAIQNVNVFESQNKTVSKNKTILIKSDSIVAIVSADDKIFAKEIIDGKGRLITSGFVDTHIHFRQMLDLANRNAPKKLDQTYRKKITKKILRYGTTTVLDMGQYESWMPTTLDWQKNPTSAYPNYYITGAAMISKEKKNPAPHHTIVQDPYKKIQEYDSLGATSIKLYSHLNIEDMKILVKEASKKGMKIFAHTDRNKVTIQEAMEVSVRNFEHFFTVVPSVLNLKTDGALMEKRFNLKPYDHIDDFAASMTFFFAYIKENAELDKKLLSLFDIMAKNEATISTTIHVLGAAAGKTSFFSSFNHFPIRNKPSYPDYTEAHKKELKKAFDIMMQYLKIAHDKGVSIRIGTDNREAGKSMASELVLLQEAGFSTKDILQIATWNGAKAMGIENEIGSVRVGMKADLIIFEKSPLDDPEHFLSKKTIIKGGEKYISETDQVVAALEIINNKDSQQMLKYINNNSKKFEAYELLEIGYHLFHIGEIEVGKSVLNQLQIVYPNFKEIYYEDAINRIAYELAENGMIEKSISTFKWNTEKFPNSSEAFENLASLYEYIEKKELAIKNYEKSLELNPDNKNVQDMLLRLRK